MTDPVSRLRSVAKGEGWGSTGLKGMGAGGVGGGGGVGDRKEGGRAVFKKPDV